MNTNRIRTSPIEAERSPRGRSRDGVVSPEVRSCRTAPIEPVAVRQEARIESPPLNSWIYFFLIAATRPPAFFNI